MDKSDALLSYIPIISSSKAIPNKNEHSCGFVVLHKGKKFIVTTSHGILENSRTGIVFVPSPYTPNVLFFNPTFVTTFKATFLAKTLKFINDKFKLKIRVKKASSLFSFHEDIDLAFCLIPNEFQAIHNVYGSPCYGKIKKVIDYSRLKEPMKTLKYCFAGIAFRQLQNGVLIFEEVFENNLSYKKTLGYYHIFKINCRSKLSGCSGAPIFNDDGDLVSIVVKKDGRKLYGANLKLLETLFDVEGGFIQ